MQLDLSKVATLDFETYYDKDYSLRSKDMNTSEYLRDKRFVAHCVGIKFGDGPTTIHWYDDIAPALEKIKPENPILCHNTAFDGLILAEHYGIVPTLYLDTLSMARALHGNQTRAGLDAVAAFYGLGNKLPNILGKMKGFTRIPEELVPQATAYTARDVDLCWAIFKQMIAIYPDDEIKLIDWTIRQFCDPVLYVDIERAKAELERERARKKELIDKTGLDEDQLQSANKFAQQLRDLGVEPPMKMSARTKMLTFAFSQQDDEFMALATHEDQRVRELIAARLAAKSTIGETRAERFVKVGDRPLPVGLNYAAAHTLRWGGTNKMNLQNLQKEDKDENGDPVPLTGELRKSIIAPPGYKIVVADSGQIEARWTAYLAGQQDMLDLFAVDGDPYCVLASEIYNREITKKNRDERAVGKAGVLGLGFYMGAKRFQGTLALGLLGPKMVVDLEFAEGVVNAYRRKNSKIVALWALMGALLHKMLMKSAGFDKTEYTTFEFPGLKVEFDAQSIWLPSGMGLHYPELTAEYNQHANKGEGAWVNYSYKSREGFSHIHPGVLTENMIQRLARDTVAGQLLKINERYRAVMMTHDEIVCIAEDYEADKCLQFMLETMAVSPSWAPGLPLKAEGGYDQCYSK